MSPCAPGTFFYTIKPGDTIWQLAQQYTTTVYTISVLNPRIDLNRLYIGQVICMPYGVAPHNPTQHSNKEFSRAELDIMNKMRQLWEEHVAWTRMTILSMAAGTADVEAVTNRLLRNPDDFAAELRPLYGNDKATKFRDLFKEHLVTAAQLIKAAKAGDSKAVADIENKWYKNADEIAATLAIMNPYWSENEWKRMLHEHLSLTKSEAVERLGHNFAADIRLYDEIQNQALKMADMMSQGIIRQFPNRF